MKTLPDKPNIHHLRWQAKDLQAGLCDSRPGVTLADAQASLARSTALNLIFDLPIRLP